MGLLGAGFVLLSYVYLGISALTLYRVITRWRALWGPRLGEADARLAAQSAFFLLLPPTVALHEAGHAVAVWAQGGQVLKVAFYGFMGAVWSASLGPQGDLLVALAGNVVTLLVGAGVLLWGLRWPGRPAANILRIELGRQSLFLVLVLYPLLCLFTQGDFRIIYDLRATPVGSGIIAAAHALILGLGWGWWWRRRGRPRALALCGPGATALVAAERALARDPEDLAARRALGSVWLESGAPERALPHLEAVLGRGQAGTELRLAYGVALAELGRGQEALPHLEQAAEAPQPDLRGLALIHLARVRAAAGEGEAALALAQEALRLRPADLAVLGAWAALMRAAGRGPEARQEVSRRAEGLTGARRAAVQAILRSLR